MNSAHAWTSLRLFKLFRCKHLNWYAQADPPDVSRIPEEDVIGVTVLLLTCSYRGQEFIRVGYYVSNDYVDESLREEPPVRVLIDKVQRNILADKPRVTKFPILFNSPGVIAPEPQEVSDAFISPTTEFDMMNTNEKASGSHTPAVVLDFTPTVEQDSDARASQPSLMFLMQNGAVRPVNLCAPQVLQEVCWEESRVSITV